MFTSDNLPLIIAVIQFVIMLLPLFRLIWRASELSSRVQNIEKNDQKQDAKIKEISNNTDASLKSILNSLNDIKVSIARLDERIANAEKNKINK